jgi:hypothetical protein
MGSLAKQRESAFVLQAAAILQRSPFAPRSAGTLLSQAQTEDLVSFLQLAMLNGWGGYILAEADYMNAFFSHDEYVDFYSQDEASFTSMREAFPSA